MNDAKYIGMDVHQATICAAARDSSRYRTCAGLPIFKVRLRHAI
jgi:hypothetical protein